MTASHLIQVRIFAAALVSLASSLETACPSSDWPSQGSCFLQRNKGKGTSAFKVEEESWLPAPTTYLKTCYMKPLGSLIIKEQKKIGPKLRAFNPSLVRSSFLPHPDAVYLATFKHANDQCDLLIEGNDARPQLQGAATTVALLREDFSIIQQADMPGSIVDARLMVHDGQFIMSYVQQTNGKDTGFHLRKFHLEWQSGGSFKVKFEDYRMGEGRNIGFFYRQQELFGITQLKEPIPTVQRMSFPPANDSEVSYLPEDPSDTGVHLNGNPVELNESDAFLLVGHVHDDQHPQLLDTSRTSCNARWGYNYRHHFFLLDRQPPFTVRRKSDPVCFPSLSDASQCEIIQFVMGVVRTEDDLLISYGINDCESAVARVSLADVMSFIDHSGYTPLLQVHGIEVVRNQSLNSSLPKL
jgi:hypothetical protein